MDYSERLSGKEKLRQMLQNIRDYVKDREKPAAHLEEDNLLVEALTLILDAETLEEAQEYADIALASQQIEYDRWYD